MSDDPEVGIGIAFLRFAGARLAADFFAEAFFTAPLRVAFLATSLSVQAPPTSIVTRLQWGDASGICRHAHCAGRRGREAEGGGLLNRYRVVKLYRGFESLRLRQNA